MCVETIVCGYRMGGNIKQSSSKVNTPEQGQLLTAAVYGFLVHCAILPDLPLHRANAIASTWGVDRAVVERLSVCGYPSEVENILICGEASAKFGDDLVYVPGFYKQTKIDDGEGEPYDFWRLDLNPRWSETGFIVPQTHKQFGFYSSLLAFRSARDTRPFTVEVRADRDRKAKAA